MACVRQYSASNVGTRKLKALIFYTINPHLYDYEKQSLCVFDPLGLDATYDVHLRLIVKPVVYFLLVNFFRYVLWFKRYERISIGIRRFWNWVGNFRRTFSTRRRRPPTICVRLEVVYKLPRWGHF